MDEGEKEQRIREGNGEKAICMFAVISYRSLRRSWRLRSQNFIFARGIYRQLASYPLVVIPCTIYCIFPSACWSYSRNIPSGYGQVTGHTDYLVVAILCTKYCCQCPFSFSVLELQPQCTQ